MKLVFEESEGNVTPVRTGVADVENIDAVVVEVWVPGTACSHSQLDNMLRGLSSKTAQGWIRPSGGLWLIDADALRESHPALQDVGWFRGTMLVPYDVEHRLSERGPIGNINSGHGLMLVGQHPFNVLSFRIDTDVAADSNRIFYSWMSDRPGFGNRNFVEDVLQKAARSIGGDSSLGVTPALDRDTAGAAGSPDIANTIFLKIARARVFVADVTEIRQMKPRRWLSLFGSEPGGYRPSPNPNVLVELGFAAGTLGWERCLLIINTAFGEPERLPFDLRQRRVISYRVARKEDRAVAKASLVPLLEVRLAEAMGVC